MILLLNCGSLENNLEIRVGIGNIRDIGLPNYSAGWDGILDGMVFWICHSNTTGITPWKPL